MPHSPNRLQRLHQTYLKLLGVCFLLLVSFTLPPPWYQLSSLGYVLLGLVMVRGLGEPVDQLQFGPTPRRLYKLLGYITLGMGLLWFLTPVHLRTSGVPVLILWSLFSSWSAIRLIRGLAQERRVTIDVLRGSIAGFLMLGLAGGLMCTALETITPGSFNNVDFASGSLPNTHLPVWTLNFVRLNYFSFVSLTTAGYGDITPETPLAQMMSVGIAIAGTFYIAAVMGLLISRLSADEQTGSGEESVTVDQPGPRDPDDGAGHRSD